MDYVTLGQSSLKVSRLCIGTMTFGVQNSEAEGHAQLDRAFAAGINFIDTAEMYAVPPSADSYGKTEQIVGTWLKRQPRDKVILATKATGPGRSLSWIRGGPSGFDAANLTAALDGSLHIVFWIGAIVAAAAFLTAFLLPKRLTGDVSLRPAAAD